MERVVVQAPAKINLTLDVTGRRDDGYHLIRSVMQSVELCDTVTVKLTGAASGLELSADDERVPLDESNTALRAARACLDAVMENSGAAIHLHKVIPMQAGLAGGSADAAGVIAALDYLLDTRLPPEALGEIGAAVGADVPFCLLGGAAEAEGTGTVLSALPSMPDCFLVLAKPPCGVSTAEAYRRIDAAQLLRRPLTGQMVEAVCSGDLESIAAGVCNVFEEALNLPEVRQIRSIMRGFRTLGCAMTGSGSAVFGIFADKADAQHCAEKLRREDNEVFVCRPSAHGPLVNA